MDDDGVSFDTFWEHNGFRNRCLCTGRDIIPDYSPRKSLQRNLTALTVESSNHPITVASSKASQWHRNHNKDSKMQFLACLMGFCFVIGNRALLTPSVKAVMNLL
jgi:hypothetical protein